jgi:isopentenyldiphosphate isomerase
MTDERIDILNDDLTVIKTCLKSDAHKYGWFHASVHIWFYTDTGDILVQKRAKEKKTFPNLWDVSVAGHITAEENEITSALREIEEEIGLKVLETDLHKIGTFKEVHRHGDDLIDNEIHHIYLCKLKNDVHLLKIQKEELSEIKLISIEDFKREIKKTNFEKTFVPHYPEYYSFVIKKISNKLGL